jgi:hypothetical protein
VFIYRENKKEKRLHEQAERLQKKSTVKRQVQVQVALPPHTRTTYIKKAAADRCCGLAPPASHDAFAPTWRLVGVMGPAQISALARPWSGQRQAVDSHSAVEHLCVHSSSGERDVTYRERELK